MEKAKFYDLLSGEMLEKCRARAEQLGIGVDEFFEKRILTAETKEMVEKTYPVDFPNEEKMKKIKEDVENFLANNQAAAAASVEAANPLTEDEKNSVLDTISEIFDMAPSDIKSEYTREEVTAYLMQSLNLGVGRKKMRVNPPEKASVHINLLRNSNRKYAVGSIKNSFSRVLQRSKTPEVARQALAEIDEGVSGTFPAYEEAEGWISDSIEYWESLRERVEQTAKEAEEFGENIPIIRPTYAQATRTKAFVEGSAQSTMLNDTTSAGKTFASLAMVGLAEEKKEKELGKGYRKSKILLVSPEQAILTGWKQEEIDRYTRSLGISKRGESKFKIGYLKDSKDFEEAMENDIIAVNYYELGCRKPLKSLVKEISAVLKREGLHNPAFEEIESSVKDSNGSGEESSHQKLLEFVEKVEAGEKVKKELAEIANQPNRFNDFLLQHVRDFDYIILDESHNLKNPNSNRALAFRQFREKTRDKRYILLDATPMHSKPADLGMAFYLIDPASYPPEKWHKTTNTNVIRELTALGKWWTMTREDIKQLYDLPDLEEKQIELGVPDDIADKYLDVFKEEMDVGEEGIRNIELSQILLESNLKYLKQVVEDELRKDPNTQIAVFTYLKKGVLDKAIDVLNSIPELEGKVCHIDGEVDFSERVEKAEKFRKGIYRASVNTVPTMSEAISLSPGDRSCSFVLLEPAKITGEYEQLVGRGYRQGQKKNTKVSIVEMVPVLSKEKQKEMKKIASGNAKMRDKALRPTWSPTTVFQNRAFTRKSYTRMKRNNMDFTSEESLKRVFEDARQSSKPLTPSEEAVMAFHTLQSYLPALEGLGSDGLERVLYTPEDELTEIESKYKIIFGHMIKIYDTKYIELTPAGNINKMIATAIRYMEEKEGRTFESIVDAGCGTATLQRVMKRPLINLDLSDKMLEKGRLLTEESMQENSDGWEGEGAGLYIRGNYTKTDSILQPESVDVINFSNTWQYTKQEGTRQDDDGRREVEDSLMCANKVLRLGGYITIVLGKGNTDEEDFNTIAHTLLPEYGFKPIVAEKYGGRESGKRVFDTSWFIVGKKVDGDVYPMDRKKSPDIYVPELNEFYVAGKLKRKVFAKRVEVSRPHASDSFASESGVSLQDMLDKGLAEME